MNVSDNRIKRSSSSSTLSVNGIGHGQYLKDIFEIQGLVFSDNHVFIATEGTLYQFESEANFKKNKPLAIYTMSFYEITLFRDQMIVIKHKNLTTEVIMLYSKDFEKIKIWYTVLVNFQKNYMKFLHQCVKGEVNVVPFEKSTFISASDLKISQEHSQRAKFLQDLNQSNQSQQ